MMFRFIKSEKLVNTQTVVPKMLQMIGCKDGTLDTATTINTSLSSENLYYIIFLLQLLPIIVIVFIQLYHDGV